MKRKFFIAAATLISSNACAQSQDLISKDSSKGLDPVVITANKFEQKQHETGKVLTIISRAELENNAARSIGEVLNQQVGISIGGANNTLGSVQSVYTRGAGTANTLILLDGIPMYDGSGISNEFDLNSFALDQVERIEILKGAQSTLYGSDAVAGVINIITRRPAKEKTKLFVDLSAGSYNTLRGSVGITGSGKHGLEYFAGYSKLYSDGFSAAHDSTGNTTFEDDGFKQDALIGSIAFKPRPATTIKFYGKYNINKAEIDAGAFTDDRDYDYQTTNTLAGTTVQFQLKKMLLSINYNYNHYKRNYNNDSVDIGGYSPDPFAFYTKYIRERYLGQSHFAELLTKTQLNKFLNLVAGTDFRKNATSQEYLYVSNYGPFEPTPLGKDTANTSQLSGFASLIFNNKKNFTLGLGGRYNHHSVYGSNGTFSVNPAYTQNRVKFFANLSSAYRVPSLYQLYSEFGNRELKPEQSLSLEGGIQFISNKLSARAVIFGRSIKDVFSFYTDPVTFQSVYINEDKQRDHGVELEASFRCDNKFSITANYSFVDGEIDTKDINGKDTSFSNLYRRPKNLFNVGVQYAPFKKLLIFIHLRSVGSIYEPRYAAAPVKLKGYYTADLGMKYQVNKSLRAFIDLKNITDQEYFDQEGFNSRRFNIIGGLSLNF